MRQLMYVLLVNSFTQITTLSNQPVAPLRAFTLALVIWSQLVICTLRDRLLTRVMVWPMVLGLVCVGCATEISRINILFVVNLVGVLLRVHLPKSTNTLRLGILQLPIHI